MCLSGVYAQENQRHIPQQINDSNSLRSVLARGKVESRFRLFLMGTDNAKNLSDYAALAFGGGLHYNSGAWKGFSFGVSGFFIWNLASSDLGRKDSITGARSRYEIGQFDVEEPHNRNDMDRLEDFYLQYNRKNIQFRFGKQEIKTPFINPQDGRMRPTGEQGIWVQLQPFDQLKVEGGWIYKMSPRGTVKWYGVSESIGLYPSGMNVSGKPSNYYNHLESGGIGVLGLKYQWPKLELQFWEHYVDRIFQTTMLQLETKSTTPSKLHLESGIQYVYQSPVANGGNKDPEKAYFDIKQQTHAVSVRAGLRVKSNTIRLNGTHISETGRFLMPREWGREPFYTFIPRERNEGSGGVNAITMNLIHENIQRKWRTELTYGFFKMPDVREVRLNKYQMPSYHQILGDVKYAFKGQASGLSVEVLYTYKIKADNKDHDPRYVINKVNMHHFNLILNYVL
jgi:hypothetical protein